MTIFIGIDDTDSKSGMCTTYLASELIREFQEYDLIGYPRLVRLNPNIPWKTRGNGAICVCFGKGSGARYPACSIDGEVYYAFEKGAGNYSLEEFRERVANIVEPHLEIDEENTNPAFLIMRKRPPQSLYWRAVRGVVEFNEVKETVSQLNGAFRLYKNGRGLIGAASALSWRPRDRTYEIITYRRREMWGKERILRKESVVRMDKNFPSTFNNFDYEEDRIAISPNSPCPVLFGIRGENPRDLILAMSVIEGEDSERWTLFLTNQATDDHLVKRRIGEVEDFESVIVSGYVVDQPKIIKGGHVVFRISDGNEIDCTAYEPSKSFRKIAASLREGDSVTVYGSVRHAPRTINIEKLRIESLANSYTKRSNPICPKCGRRMKSAGRGVGYRCRGCHIKVGEELVELTPLKRNISPGIYEPPVSARRHLSKPLKRLTR